MQKIIDGQFIDCAQEDLVEGDIYRIPVGQGGWQQQAYSSAVVTPPAIRHISKRAFRNRLTQPERTLIRKSTDDIVIDIKEELEMTTYVDLDMPSNTDALNYLVSVGILLAPRVAEILVDGTKKEEF